MSHTRLDICVIWKFKKKEQSYHRSDENSITARKRTMEQAGDGDLNANVDIAHSVVNEYKSSDNIDGDQHTDIGTIGDPGEGAEKLYRLIRCANALP